MTALWDGLAAYVTAGSADRAAKQEGPLDLACQLTPGTLRTPALELLSAELEHAISTPRSRLAVSIAPQEGKSQLARHAVIRALQRNPDTRVVFASYSVDLSRTSGRAIRQSIDQHGSRAVDPATREPLPDLLGIAVASDHAAAADWSLVGNRGGMVCVGVGSGLTGRPVDLLLVDDPIKDMRDADSPVMRSRLMDWWVAVAETRLAPGASVIVIQTRWHELDLIGQLLAADAERETPEWRVVNVPALADGRTLDALDRPVGEWLQSARGRTPEQWEKIRQRVGARVFASLYQGRPAPLEGGLFLRAWFDENRVRERPANSLPPVIVCDPADNLGDGDEAGILVASADTNGHVYLGPDYSGHMTTARWVRVALLAVVRHQAGALAYERSLSGLSRAVRAGWESLQKQALVLRRFGSTEAGAWPAAIDPDVIEAALNELSHPYDSDDTRAGLQRELIELWPLVAEVTGFPSTGPNIRMIQAKGSKQLRAQLAAPAYEQRRVHHVGTLAEAEHEMSVWMPGQASPNRLDAAVHAVMLLTGASVSSIGRSTDRVPTNSTSLRNKSSSRITRSTRR